MSDTRSHSWGHGHVTPNPDGSKARCWGPGFCKQCDAEAKAIAQRKQEQQEHQLQWEWQDGYPLGAAENQRRLRSADVAELLAELAMRHETLVVVRTEPFQAGLPTSHSTFTGDGKEALRITLAFLSTLLSELLENPPSWIQSQSALEQFKASLPSADC